MAWLLSTGAKSARTKLRATAVRAVYATTISCGDGTGADGRDQVLDSGNGLAGFVVGEEVTILGGANNGVHFRVLSVAAGTLEAPAGTLATQATGTGHFLVACRGGSLRDIFANMTVKLYSGARPTSADDAEIGTLLASLTLNGDAFVSGSPVNGLNFGDSGGLTMGAETDPATGVDELWEDDDPPATGSAQSCWIYANLVVQGASTTAIRMVGRCGTSGVECNMPAGTAITAGVPVQGLTIAITG